MRKLWIGVFVFAIAALATTAAFACGDHLMLLLGGARFQQVFGGARPASILAYTRGDSAVPRVVKDLELQPALKRAGHKLRAVEDRAAFDEALKTGKYDVVLADVTDAEGLEQQVGSAPSKPTLLPVIYKATKSEATAVKQKFRSVLKAPGSSGDYLAAIDAAMKVRLQDGPLKVAGLKVAR